LKFQLSPLNASLTLSSSKIQNGDISVPPGKWLLNRSVCYSYTGSCFEVKIERQAVEQDDKDHIHVLCVTDALEANSIWLCTRSYTVQRNVFPVLSVRRVFPICTTWTDTWTSTAPSTGAPSAERVFRELKTCRHTWKHTRERNQHSLHHQMSRLRWGPWIVEGNLTGIWVRIKFCIPL